MKIIMCNSLVPQEWALSLSTMTEQAEENGATIPTYQIQFDIRRYGVFSSMSVVVFRMVFFLEIEPCSLRVF